MDNIISQIVILIGAIGGTGLFTFLQTRKKYEVDVLQSKENAETTAIDNDIKLSAHYKEILDDLKNRYEIRYKEFEDMMNKKFQLLEEEIVMKDKRVKLLQQEITELKKENRILKANAKAVTT